MTFHCMFLLILFVANSLAANKIPLSTYKRIQGLSTYDFAKSHLHRQRQVAGGVLPIARPESRPHGRPSEVVPPRQDSQAPQLVESAYLGENQIFTPDGSIQPQNVMAQLEVPEQAGCTPLPQPMHLPPDRDPTVIYHPSCILVNKCTGCCSPDSVVSCQPTARLVKPVQVIKGRYIGGEQFAYEGIVEVMVEEDEACECLCTVKATACNPFIHRYDSDTCACRCTNEHLASSCVHPRTWSESQCECTCPPVTCPPGQTFHGPTCTCLAPFSLTTADPCVASKRCRSGYRGTTTPMGCVCRRARHD